MGKVVIEQNSPAIADEKIDHYDFKPDRFGSHSLILKEFDVSGMGRRVLDIGCGQGHLARLLNERGYEVVGVDQNTGALGVAAQWCRQTIHGDIDTTLERLDGQKFAYVLLADVLEHLRDPEEMLSRLMALLTDDGVLIVSVPNVAHLYVRLMLLFGRWNYSDRGILDRTHLRFFTRKSLRELLAKSGVSLRNISATTLPWSIILSSKPKPVVDVCETVDHLAERVWPSLFAYQWVVSGVKGATDG